MLQSQLLQPINITPIQPSLEESNLLILEGAGPSDPSFNEFNPLFTRNRLILQASGVFGSNDTLGDEVTQSGVWGKYSYSLGQFHFETDGFRENNDLRRDLYTAFLQASISSNTSAQVEFRYSDQENGDLPLRFDPRNFFQFRQATETQNYRIGLRHAFGLRSEMIASAIFENTDDSAQAPDRSFVSETKERTRTFEVQHIYRTKYANFVSGMGHYDLDIDAEGQSQFGSFADNEDGFGNNLYLYMQLNPILPNLRMELGISYDRMEDIGVSRSQVNPKVGLIWNPFNGTTVRAAAFKVVKRAFTANRTIEPTVVAGFNQFFDDLNGTIAKRAGFAIDQKFSERIYGGIEVSGRNLSRVPRIPVGEFDWNERNAQAYLYWTPYDWFTTAIEYQYERFNRLFEHRGPEDIIDVETHKVPVSLGLFHPSGLSAGQSCPI